MSNKSKKYSGFRDFYEDDERPRKKPKMNEQKREKDKFRKQIRFLDPKNIEEDTFEDIDALEYLDDEDDVK
jgi:hypothetical protein